jgi:adenylate cyclase
VGQWPWPRTVVSDMVASICDSGAAAIGFDIVFAENTRNQSEGAAMLELDLIQVKGKTVPVHIYALMGDEEFKGGEAFTRLAASHKEMIAVYRGQDWKAAQGLVDRCREINGELALGLKLDVLYELYEERTAEFKESPPPEDWDGVFVATSK